MPKIRIDLNTTPSNGRSLTFKAPADCSDITGLIVYYPEGDTTTSKDFQFADSHGVDVGSGTISLFAANALVKVVLDIDQNKAYVQNADTNAYLEGELAKKYSPDNKPSPEDIGAEPKGTAANAVSAHNINTAAHSDLRLELKALADRVNAVLDSDDATLDELSEIVSYIKSNKSLIDAITTSKVNVSDIVNNLVTNVANKPLSAAQGVALKALYDALQTAVNDKAPKSHGNHVPETETANNARFLRNDNTWQAVTPANIGASPTGHNHSKSEITDFPSSMTPTAHNQAASTITAGTFAGQVVANSGGQTPGTSLLRNCKLVSADTNPTVNGEICWTYK